MKRFLRLVGMGTVAVSSFTLATAFITAAPGLPTTGKIESKLKLSMQDDGPAGNDLSEEDLRSCGRREILASFGLLATAGANPLAAVALVEGNAPPGKKKTLSDEYLQGTAALGDMDDQAPVPREAYKKLSSGVIYADLRKGSPDGATVKEGSRVNLQWVLRKSNGYFVDSSAVSDSIPFIFTVGDGSAIAGLDEGVRGMVNGGVRRILIPPRLAYVDGVEDGKPGPLPAGFGPRQQIRRVQTVRADVPGEYLFLEVQVTRVR